MACIWKVECVDEPSGARRFFFFSVQVYTLRVRWGITYGHKKAPLGANLAGLVGVAGGLDAVILFDCCAKYLGVVCFEACD